MGGQGDRPPSLLHLLYDEAPLADFDALLAGSSGRERPRLPRRRAPSTTSP